MCTLNCDCKLKANISITKCSQLAANRHSHLIVQQMNCAFNCTEQICRPHQKRWKKILKSVEEDWEESRHTCMPAACCRLWCVLSSECPHANERTDWRTPLAMSGRQWLPAQVDQAPSDAGNVWVCVLVPSVIGNFRSSVNNFAMCTVVATISLTTTSAALTVTLKSCP